MNTFLGQIGIAGWVLIALAFWSLYTFVKYGLYLLLISRDFRKGFHKFESGELDLLTYEPKRWNPMSAIMRDVARFHAHHSRDLKSEVAFLFYKYFHRLNLAAAWLRMIAVIAPLLGLLGTVTGMVKMFKSLAVESQVDGSLLAAGIWEALLTTVIGLCVAIPTLVFYYAISLRLKGFSVESIEYGYRVLGIIAPQCPYGKALQDAQTATSQATGNNDV